MTPVEEATVLLPVYLRGDRILRYATAIHVGIALAIAPVYETWAIAVPVAFLATAMFWACAWLLPGHFITRVVGGISLQVFCALHIYQLHGMPEMHFFFFTSFTLMILYKDWKSMWPATVLIIGQHILFAVLHNSGVKVFFFEETRVGLFKLFFHFGIALADVSIASVVAQSLRARTLNDHLRADELSTQLAAKTQLMAELQSTRDRLVRTEKLATAGQLAAGVGHEINNPLAFVKGNLDHLRHRFTEERALLSGLPDFADLQSCLSEADEGADRIAAIVRDLKTFARGDDNQLRAINVKQSLEFALSMASPELRHRAEIIRDYGDVPPVEANETKLGQVFLVLLVNAAQALKDGHATTNRVTVRTRLDADGRVRITVSDTGPGIAPELMERIFDPFFTTKPVGEGTGLGLSIAHHIVVALNGRIEVESRPGEGAHFHVVLPASLGVAAPRRSGKTPPQAVAAQALARVLVIDDEHAMAPLVTRLLGAVAQVKAAHSGREGLELLRHEHFDLVLCDVMMPDVSGPEVYAVLKRERPELLPRLVMMTGGAFTEESRKFVEELPNETLEKPFSAAALRSLVDVMRKRGAA